MTHRFPVKELARQSGLSTATVDRVLNERAHVSPQSRLRVAAAIEELETQERQQVARGRRMFIDVVVEAPARFSDQIKVATTAVLDQVTEAVYRPRFITQDLMSPDELAAIVQRIRARGSQGLILKARDTPQVRALVTELTAAKIPVVTLVTDISQSDRLAYLGIDNAQAGKTAAYLIANLCAPEPALVLATRSQSDFQGEALRFETFGSQLAELAPQLTISEVVGGAGLAASTGAQVRRLLAAQPKAEIAAVYSMGGGNQAILQALSEFDLSPQHFIAHDLDRENQALLAAQEIDFVLHHDLQTDMRNALRALSAWHGLAPPLEFEGLASQLQIITPFNLP